MLPEYRIYLGADHRGFKKKEELFPMLNECHENVTVEDMGAESYVEDDDFNDPAIAVAQAVAENEHSIGVLLCGSAHGVCMQANRIKGARAINATTVDSARLGREHDHANILCLAADELDVDTMEQLIKAFCHARPSTEKRYSRRVVRLDQNPAEFEGGFRVKTATSKDDADEDEEE